MRHLILITLFVFFVNSTLLSAMNELKWGGPGYDPALKGSSRFIARHNISNEENIIQIYVDSKETVKEVGQMQLIVSDGEKIFSVQCWKAMRHMTAPWACSFQIDDIKQLSGEGKIRVSDKSGKTLSEDDVDLAKLSSFVVDSENNQ